MATDDQLPGEDPNVPYIESPETMEIPEEKSGLLCFINPDRVCDSDCMAFLVACPEGRDYEGQQWSKCMLLVNAHKVGKHAVAIAGQGDGLLKHLRVKRADEIREGNKGA
jgi:hypothetical protein